MNAINLALIQGAALPQQAVSGSNQPALPDGLQFALWLGQFGAASAGPGTQPNGQQPALAGKLPAELVPLLQQLAGQTDAQAVSATQAQPGLKLDAMLQALLDAVLEALRGVLDAGGQGQAAAQQGQDLTPPAGETATAASVMTASAANEPASTKQAAVMWLQDEPAATKQAAVMWLQGEPAATKQAAVMWLQGEPAATKQAAVMWLQDAALPSKQATQTLPQAASAQPLMDSQAGTAVPPVTAGPDVSQMLQDLWPKLAAQLQAMLLSRFGLAAQVGPLTPQSPASTPAPMPWAAQTLASASSTQLPAELALQSSQAAVPLTIQVVGGTPTQSSGGSVPALPAGLGVAPASIRWFALGGLDSLQTPSGVSAAPAESTAEAPALSIAGSVVLPTGALVKAIIAAEPRLDPAGVQPALLDGAQPVAESQNFIVSMLSTAEDPNLLVAKLSVRRVATPGNQLPLQQPLWASQTPAPMTLGISQSLWQPAQTTLVSAGSLPTGRPAAAQLTEAIQPTAVVQPTAVALTSVVQPETVVQAMTVAQQTGAIPIQPQVTPALPVTGEQLAAASVAIAPEQVRQAAQIHAAVKADATQLLAKAQDAAPVEPAALSEPAPQTAAVHPQTGAFILRPAASVVGKAPQWDAAPSADAATPGVAFNALPAQLMQFSGREFELKPYAGLQFSELTGKLLEQAATARSQGDGTYQATLDLNPPSLGRMSVNIAVHGDSVAMQLSVASGAPREQLTSNLAALQRSLEEAGLHVVELKVVTVDPDGQPAKQYHEQQQQPQANAADEEALRLAFRQELGADYA